MYPVGKCCRWGGLYKCFMGENTGWDLFYTRHFSPTTSKILKRPQRENYRGGGGDILNGGPKTGPVLRSDYSIIKQMLITDSCEVERTLDPSPFYTNKRGRTTMATVPAEPFPRPSMFLLDVQRLSENQACPIGPDVTLREGSSTMPRWQSLSRFP